MSRDRKQTTTDKKTSKAKSPKKPKKIDEVNLSSSKDASLQHNVIARSVPIKIVADDPVFVPQYKTAGAANADLVANIPEDVHGNRTLTLTSRTGAVVDCGFSMELPPGWKAEIAARSGLASKNLVVSNAPGQIDEDYRGRVRVLVTNIGKEIITINDQERIAQMWVTPVHRMSFEMVDELSATERGEGGLGSTGL